MTRTFPLILGCMLLAAGAAGQTATVSVEQENLRAAPGGVVLAEVLRGTSMALEERRDGWARVVLDGWIWEPSVGAQQADGHDLVVSVPGGENLRLTPNGDRLARLLQGMRLDRVEQRGSWIHVRRRGWIWQQSVTLTGVAAAPAPGRTAPSTSGGAAAGALRRTGQAGAAVLGTPDGDTLAAVRPGAELEVVSREGNWARVRLTGWAWAPSLAAASDTGSVLRGIASAVLADNPESFQGRLVEWTVQFISLERAERIRTDFYEGEPFMLTRGPGSEQGFVYVAVPPDQLEAVRALSPLDRVQMLARVRTGRSPLMNAPVLELVRIEQAGPPGG